MNFSFIKKVSFSCILLSLMPSAFSFCNHMIVDRDARFACVTISNLSKNNVSTTGLSGGMNLKPGESGETMLLLGGSDNLIVSPSPYSPYSDSKLTCSISITDARENKISINYEGNDRFSTLPKVFASDCYFNA